ncbi:hypothetical protein BZG36_02531 [Bifiguratus adelaidae]|uniref:von Willebrand factor A domain-containing protein 8 n=1 Tax=Bifiguratus adelaidae TaxID=1938954 RepID=A0A261Y288_9FUNG|nr:hypothetical protein BZG36_02531 [Bifiguratus adelaidae]
MKLFGSLGGAKKRSAKDAILQMRETLTQLEKRQTYLESKVENELKVAKANATKNKRACTVALLALKKKKVYEGQIEKLSGARMTLETQMIKIEDANVNLETMNAMKAGSDAMRNIHGSMDINKVDQTMDEIRDQMDIADEISNAIARPVGFGEEIDEDELLQELDELEQLELDAKILETPNPVYAPTVPNHEPRVAQEEDDNDAELKELQATKVLDNGVAGRYSDDEDEGMEGKTGGLVMQPTRAIQVANVRLGDVSIKVERPEKPHKVPIYVDPLYDTSQEVLRHLRWMMQKDKLRQDMFLIGLPGPLRRALVMKYAEMTKREIEYVALSKDVTDSDLKQRRELSSGTSFYVDQAAVRAAIHGRILVLDGIEKAERNVLPILNNLLENREMALDDGRFLTRRVDDAALQGQDGQQWKLERVHERFLVFALGLPIPRYPGYPLDPPLRSRFQSRDIKPPGFDAQVEQFLTVVGDKTGRCRDAAERVISVSLVLGIPKGDLESAGASEIDVPEFALSVDSMARILRQFPDTHLRYLIDVHYPYPLLPTCDSEQRSVIQSIYHRFGVLYAPVLSGEKQEVNYEDMKRIWSGYVLRHIHRPTGPAPLTVDGKRAIHTARIAVQHVNKATVETELFCGGAPFSVDQHFVETPSTAHILISMLMVHATNQDFCLIGTHKGVGKSALVRQFGKMLGYSTEYIPLYRDMSSRDLLQRRTTTFSGDTIWQNSLLVEAALRGHLAVLDGIETLSFGTLATLQRLVHEREVHLPDGKQLLHPVRYKTLLEEHGYTVEQLDELGCYPIHPAFRIVCLARAAATGGSGGDDGKRAGGWLGPETLSMFRFIAVGGYPFDEEMLILSNLSPGVNVDSLKRLLQFANRLRRDSDETVKMLSNALSTRQLIRICRRMTYFPNESLHTAIHKVSLSRFMPQIGRQALDTLMTENGIKRPPPSSDILTIERLPTKDEATEIRIGDVTEPIRQGVNPMLVPNILFHENPMQTEILQQMLKDYQLGEHLLLIGNQGVGKNKLADYFLQLLHLPREYIQLHRDSTVQSLTATPAIKEGVLMYEDSPLVKAVKEGYILVVDEADKAPTYVTAVLKSLVEDGQMVLGDGRRIVADPEMIDQYDPVDDDDEDSVIVVHKDFRMIVLANRPGFPFLGNDFYREIGDVFSCFAVDNPDMESEMFLLRKYGPDVPADLLLKLSAAFTDLRKLVDEGLISYPYSTRELVNIVRHMHLYPDEGISRVLQNVFDFDQYDKASKDLLIETFEKHGIPIGLESDFSINLGEAVETGDPIPTELWSRKDASKPIVVDSAPLVFRGGWDLNAGKEWKALDRSEGRSMTFTEQLYNFKLPSRGEALDIGALDDGQLFAVTTNPVTLHRVDRRHLQVNSIDLYEYFPLQRAPPRLKMAVVKVQGQVKYITLHNPSNNELLCCDFEKNTVVSVILRGLDPVHSIMVKSMAEHGILAFYQADHTGIALLDFNRNLQYLLRSPVRIAQLHIVEPELWVIRDSVTGVHYMLHTDRQSSAPMPTIATPLDITGHGRVSPTEIVEIANIDAANGRFLTNKNEHSFASVLRSFTIDNVHKGFAEPVEVHSYMRPPSESGKNMYSNLRTSSIYLRATNQYAVVNPLKDSRSKGTLELVNPQQKRVWRIIIPLAVPATSTLIDDVPFGGYTLPQHDRIAAVMCELADGSLATMDNSGMVRVWQVNAEQLFKAAQTWKQMVGVDPRILSIIYQDEDGEDIDEDDGEKGGNGGEGEGNGSGSGGSGGSGSGGEGGEGQGGSGGGGDPALTEGGREANFDDVSNLTLRNNAEKKELSEAQKQLHELAMQKRLQQINMTQADGMLFQKLLNNVSREIRELRVILESLEAKNKERVWLKNQTSGDLDDTRIIEGITGERAIYKKRGDDDEIGMFQQKPKRMYFVFDLSASMYRFNTHDRRLERSMEVALMIMESFKGFEYKFAYQILGHSGDGASIEFVKEGKYPKTEKDCFEVISKMRAHSQFCLSGDNTLGATANAVKNITKEEGDDYFVVVLSDANIAQYNISPADIARILKSDDRVTAQMIFIGSLADQASSLKKALGSHATICMENKDLPKIMKSLFLSSMLKG